jgi:2-oxoglutarate ferredoxin oxidoreductase subunit alpha
LEKENITGNISYDPANHQEMVRIRQEKVDRIADSSTPAARQRSRTKGHPGTWMGQYHGAIKSASE